MYQNLSRASHHTSIRQANSRQLHTLNRIRRLVSGQSILIIAGSMIAFGQEVQEQSRRDRTMMRCGPFGQRYAKSHVLVS
jgi:hypothetical protein